MASSSEPLELSRFFPVPGWDVFEAWVMPAVMKKWMFSSPDNEIVNITNDARPGGHFSILEKNNGEEIDHFGEYFEVNFPHELKFSLEVPKHFAGKTEISITITDVADGCEFKFLQAGVDPELVRKNWMDMFEQLELVLVSG